MAQRIDGCGRHELLVQQHLQHIERRLDLQASIAATANGLEYLRNELDLADATAAELDVVMHVAPVHVALDMHLEVAHGSKGAIIQILAEYERPQQSGEIITRTGNDAPLDPCIALPLTPLVLVILLQHGETTSQRPIRTIRPQSHIHAEHEAILGDFVECSDELFG